MFTCRAGVLLAAMLANVLSPAHAIAGEPHVQFSHAHGLYERPFELALSGTGTAEIYYTTDAGGAGSKSAKRYDGPISITATTVVRAWPQPSRGGAPEVVTRSYIFPGKVLHQTAAGFPATWGEKKGKPVPASYGICPQLAQDHAFAELDRGLRAIPTMSLVLDPADLFGAEAGIYAHPEEQGRDWERRGSVEFIHPDGRAGFQSDCGVRIHGGWSRRPEESPKHGFRLLFRKRDGVAALDYPLFGEKNHEFTTLILRGGNNDTFLHPSSEERRRAEYARDQWMRESHAAMGYPAARGLFVHLYLNGLYWGVYNLTERPDAAFAAAALGGKKDDYDTRRADKALSGDKAAWDDLLAIAEAGVAHPSEYDAIARHLDLTAFIDFMILNLYGGNSDWDGSSNWYAFRNHEHGGRFQFLVWDGERTLEEVDRNVVAYDAKGSPPRLFQRLRANPEFRLAFADRAAKHFFGVGALAPAAAAARYRARSDVLDAAIVGESARWGAYRRDVHPFRTGPYELYTRDAHVRPEVARLLQQYFPRRTGLVLQQFREAGLYPKADTPEVRIDGGRVYLDATAERTIYFTTDGSDPRLAGGGISPAAKRYEGPVTDAKELKARSWDDAGEWSALVQVDGGTSPRE
jgi:hypothetical protein